MRGVRIDLVEVCATHASLGVADCELALLWEWLRLCVCVGFSLQIPARPAHNWRSHSNRSNSRRCHHLSERKTVWLTENLLDRLKCAHWRHPFRQPHLDLGRWWTPYIGFKWTLYSPFGCKLRGDATTSTTKKVKWEVNSEGPGNRMNLCVCAVILEKAVFKMHIEIKKTFLFCRGYVAVWSNKRWPETVKCNQVWRWSSTEKIAGARSIAIVGCVCVKRGGKGGREGKGWLQAA